MISPRNCEYITIGTFPIVTKLLTASTVVRPFNDEITKPDDYFGIASTGAGWPRCS